MPYESPVNTTALSKEQKLSLLQSIFPITSAKWLSIEVF